MFWVFISWTGWGQRWARRDPRPQRKSKWGSCPQKALAVELCPSRLRRLRCRLRSLLPARWGPRSAQLPDRGNSWKHGDKCQYKGRLLDSWVIWVTNSSDWAHLQLYMSVCIEQIVLHRTGLWKNFLPFKILNWPTNKPLTNDNVCKSYSELITKKI